MLLRIRSGRSRGMTFLRMLTTLNVLAGWLGHVVLP